MFPLSGSRRTSVALVGLLMVFAFFWQTRAMAATPLDYAMPFARQSDGGNPKGIHLVNSANFAQRAALVPFSVDLGAATTFRKGRVQGASILDVRPHTLVYARSGRWYRANLRGGLSPSPERFSREAEATEVCSTSVIDMDASSEEGAWLFYALPPEPDGCDLPGQQIRALQIFGPASQVPVNLNADSPAIAPLYAANGRLRGFYVLFNQRLRFYNRNLTASTVVAAGVNDFELLGADGFGGALLLVNDLVRRAHADGTLYPGALKRVSAGFSLQDLYLAYGEVFLHEVATNPFATIISRFFRVPLDQSASATFMHGVRTRAFPAGLSGNELIYSTGGGFSFVDATPTSDADVVALPLNAPALPARRLYRLRDAVSMLDIISVSDGRVFFNRLHVEQAGQAPVSRGFRAAIDGSGVRNEGRGSRWLGGLAPQSNLLRGPGFEINPAPISTLVLLQGASAGSEGIETGGRLLAVDPASLARTVLGGVTAHTYFGPGLFRQFSPSFISFTLELNGMGDIDTDVFALNPNSGDMRRLSNTSTANEFPVF